MAAETTAPTQRQDPGAIRAERQALLGRIAGVLFMCGAVASFPAGQVLDYAEGRDGIYATNLLALATGLICLALPWRRLPFWASHVIPPLAAVEVMLAVVVGGEHGSVYAWYFVLGGVYTGYAFRVRKQMAAHLGF